MADLGKRAQAMRRPTGEWSDSGKKFAERARAGELLATMTAQGRVFVNDTKGRVTTASNAVLLECLPPNFCEEMPNLSQLAAFVESVDGFLMHRVSGPSVKLAEDHKRWAHEEAVNGKRLLIVQKKKTINAKRTTTQLVPGRLLRRRGKTDVVKRKITKPKKKKPEVVDLELVGPTLGTALRKRLRLFKKEAAVGIPTPTPCPTKTEISDTEIEDSETEPPPAAQDTELARTDMDPSGAGPIAEHRPVGDTVDLTPANSPSEEGDVEIIASTPAFFIVSDVKAKGLWVKEFMCDKCGLDFEFSEKIAVQGDHTSHVHCLTPFASAGAAPEPPETPKASRWTRAIESDVDTETPEGSAPGAELVSTVLANLRAVPPVRPRAHQELKAAKKEAAMERNASKKARAADPTLKHEPQVVKREPNENPEPKVKPETGVMPELKVKPEPKVKPDPKVKPETEVPPQPEDLEETRARELNHERVLAAKPMLVSTESYQIRFEPRMRKEGAAFTWKKPLLQVVVRFKSDSKVAQKSKTFRLDMTVLIEETMAHFTTELEKVFATARGWADDELARPRP